MAASWKCTGGERRNRSPQAVVSEQKCHILQTTHADTGATDDVAILSAERDLQCCVDAFDDPDHVLDIVDLREQDGELVATQSRNEVSGAHGFLDPGGNDLEWYEGLLRRGFLVRPGSEFGLDGHLRITVGPPALMDSVLQAVVDLRNDLVRERTTAAG